MTILAKLTVISGNPGVDDPSQVKYRIDPLDPEDDVDGFISSGILTENSSLLIKNASGNLAQVTLEDLQTLVNIGGSIQALDLDRLGPFIAQDSSEVLNVLWTAAKITNYVNSVIEDLEGLANPLNQDLDVGSFKVVSGATELLSKAGTRVRLNGQEVLPVDETEPPVAGYIPYVKNNGGNLFIGFREDTGGIPNPVNEDIDLDTHGVVSGATELLKLEGGKVRLGGLEVVPSLFTTPANLDIPVYISANNRIENKTLGWLRDQIGLTPSLQVAYLLGPTANLFWTGLSEGKVTQDWAFPFDHGSEGMDPLVTLVNGTNELGETDKPMILDFTSAGIYYLDLGIGCLNLNASSLSAEIELWYRTSEKADDETPDPAASQDFELTIDGANVDYSFTPAAGDLDTHVLEFGSDFGLADIDSQSFFDAASPTVTGTIFTVDGSPWPADEDIYVTVKSLISSDPNTYSPKSRTFIVNMADGIRPYSAFSKENSVGTMAGSGTGAVAGNSLFTIFGKAVLIVGAGDQLKIRMKHRQTFYNSNTMNLVNSGRVIITKLK